MQDSDSKQTEQTQKPLTSENEVMPATHHGAYIGPPLGDRALYPVIEQDIATAMREYHALSCPTLEELAGPSRVTASGKPPVLPEDSPAPAPIDPRSGQHEDHWVLSAEERAKGFVRPVRECYVHQRCGVVTRMGRVIAETYARDPKFYGSTFCCGCTGYFSLLNADGSRAFKWDDGSAQGVGE